MRRLIYLLVILTVLTASLPVLAQEYTLTDLLKVAETESSQVSVRLKELKNLVTDLRILETNYRPKLTLSGKPLQVSPNLKDDSLEFDTNATLAGSLQFPWGLELSSNLNLVNLYDSATRDLNYSLSLKYEIYPGQKTDSLQLQKESKEQALQKNEWNLQTARLEVERQLTKKFYTALILEEKLGLSRAAEEEAAADLVLYQNLYKRGDVSERELLEKEIAYQSSQVSLERSEQQYQNSLKDLLLYAGISLSDLAEVAEIQLTGSLMDVTNLPLVTPDELPAFEQLQMQARESSVTYKVACLDLQVAEEELARMQNWPEIKSEFQYKPVAGSKEDDYTWALTLTANYTLNDGGRLKLERSKQEETVADLAESVTNTELEIFDQVQTRITNLQIAYLEYLNAGLDLRKNRLDQEIKEEQLAKGIITQGQYDSGQRTVQSKELDLVQKGLDYQITYWDLVQFVYAQSIISEVVQ